jgi:hypothetical protein
MGGSDGSFLRYSYFFDANASNQEKGWLRGFSGLIFFCGGMVKLSITNFWKKAYQPFFKWC